MKKEGRQVQKSDNFKGKIKILYNFVFLSLLLNF